MRYSIKIYNTVLAFSFYLFCFQHTNATPVKDSSVCKVIFKHNYDGAAKADTLLVKKGGFIAVKDKPVAERNGYRLAGWYTSSSPSITDGISAEEWLFGERKIPMFSYFAPKDDTPNSMSVNSDITLYARWVAPVAIHTAKDLLLLHKDLRGWYVLQNNIDVKNIVWQPVGTYDLSYEYAVPDWWQKAFQGLLDGNGYSIINLKISEPSNTPAMFGAIANGTVKNLTIKNYSIDVRSASGQSFLYAAPLAGFIHGTTIISNCHTNGNVKANLTDESSDMSFASAAGLVAGAWGGEVMGCSASGNISLQTNSNNGGEIYAAGITGEAYCTTVNCTSNVNISCASVSKAIPLAGGKDVHLEIFAGGINGASTYVMNCVAKGSIVTALTKSSGESALNVGGITGSERYGFVENCASHVNIKVNEASKLYAAGIIGSFSTQYGLIGFAMGVKRYEATHCYATGKIVTGIKVNKELLHLGGIIGEIPTEIESEYLPNKKMAMPYKAINCAYVDYYKKALLNDSNAVIKKYSGITNMKGVALKELLGNESWQYDAGKLPVPVKKEKWVLK